MLFKNGKPYQMTDEEKKTLREKFSFPLRLVYPPELIKPSRLNRLPDKPNSIPMPLRTVIQNKDGETEEWRWARNTTMDAARMIKYFPRRMAFQGNSMIAETNLELLYFLYWKSPHCKNGGIAKDQRKKIYFMIEDVVLIAKNKVSGEALRARYKVMVYDDELGLPAHRLRALAKAYFIPRVDDLELVQVRVAIDVEVSRDLRNGIANFIEMSNSDEYIKLRSKLQIAIDKDILTFSPRTHMWSWKGDPKYQRPDEEICRVLAKAEPKQALIDWYEANLDFKERLNNEIEELTSMEPEDTKVPVEKIVTDPDGLGE